MAWATTEMESIFGLPRRAWQSSRTAASWATKGSGIDIAYDTLGYASLINVSYFGNDTDLDGDLNYYLHPFTP